MDILPFRSLVAKEPDMEILRVVFFASLFVGQFAVPGWAVAADKGYCSCLGYEVQLTPGYKMCRSCRDGETEKDDCIGGCNISEDCSSPSENGTRDCMWQRQCSHQVSSNCKRAPRGFDLFISCPKYSSNEYSCKQTRPNATCVFIKKDKEDSFVESEEYKCF